MERYSLAGRLPPPAAGLKLSVIIPAKNEASGIKAALAALYHQTDSYGKPLDKRDYEVTVLANNCTDATASVVRRFADAHPDFRLYVVSLCLPASHAHVGYARRLLMDEAHRRFILLGRPRGIIASTDGDTVVDTTWVAHTIRAIDQGADAVGGRIFTFAHHLGRRYYLQDAVYRYLQAQLESIVDPSPADPWPRHFQNFGPSLAVTATMYERAGRLPTLPTLEDVRFYEALQQHDAYIRHCPRVQVYTSARTQGQVDFGFSRQLQQWEEMRQWGVPLLVLEADYWVFRFTLQRQTRHAWQQQSFTLLQSVARSLSLSPYERYDQMREARYFGKFWQEMMTLPEVEKLLTQRFGLVPIATAIAHLRQYVQRIKAFVPTNPGDTAPFVDGDGVPVDGWSAPDDETHRVPRLRSTGSW